MSPDALENRNASRPPACQGMFTHWDLSYTEDSSLQFGSDQTMVDSRGGLQHDNELSFTQDCMRLLMDDDMLVLGADACSAYAASFNEGVSASCELLSDRCDCSVQYLELPDTEETLATYSAIGSSLDFVTEEALATETYFYCVQGDRLILQNLDDEEPRVLVLRR